MIEGERGTEVEKNDRGRETFKKHLFTFKKHLFTFKKLIF